MEIDKQRAALLLLACTLLLLLFSGSIVLAFGQDQAATPAPAPSSKTDGTQKHYDHWHQYDRYRGHMRPGFHSRHSMGDGLRLGPPGRWWNNPEMASKLGLTTDQQKKMDGIFQQNRLSLIDLVAAVEKQEVILQPLLAADQPDETKIIAQIDRVAQARADLEKSNARMLLGLRRVLTQDQWKKLQSMRGGGGDGPRDGFGGDHGGWRGGAGGDGPSQPPPGS